MDNSALSRNVIANNQIGMFLCEWHTYEVSGEVTRWATSGIIHAKLEYLGYDNNITKYTPCYILP